jgi:hypothetical protein
VLARVLQRKALVNDLLRNLTQLVTLGAQLKNALDHVFL